MKRFLRSPLLLASAATIATSGLGTSQTTVFHFRVNDTDEANLPTIPSVGGTDGMAIGATPLSADVPTVGVPAGAGNRSIQGAGLPGGGVNSAGAQELLNADIVAEGGFTYEAWFKWNGAGNVNSIIDYAGTEKFRIPGGGGNLDMNFDSGSGPLALGAVTAGQWHYIALVFEHDGNPEVGGQISGTATWYLDDVIATGSAPVTKDDFGDSLNRPIGVGRHPLGFGGDNFDGLIYEPRVTLGALAPNELLYDPAPLSDPQLRVSTSASGASDGTAIQIDVPIANLPGTTLDLVLTAPGLAGPNAADFAVNGFDTPIAADGGTGSIVVDFTPSAGDGLYEATLTINSNDPNNPAFDVLLSIEVRTPTGKSTILHFSVNDTDEATVTGGTVPGVDGAPDGTVAFGANLGLSTDLPTEGVPAGAGNRALLFDGTQAVTIPGTMQLANAEVVGAGGFTYELWFKWAGDGTVNSLIDYAGTEKFRIPSGSGFPLDMNFDSGSGALVLEQAPTAEEWHYIAAVFEHDGGPEVGGQISGTLTWYYDGTEAVDTIPATKDDFGDSLNRTVGVGGHPLGFGADFFNGLIFEPRVSLGALAPDELLYGNNGGQGLPLLEVKHLTDTNELLLRWESSAGNLYRLRSETDPSAGSPAEWPTDIDGTSYEDIVATPPENALAIPFPSNPTRLFVIEQYPVPPTVAFSDDFESGQGSWIISNAEPGDLPATNWEFGSPDTGLAGGPVAANSGANCFGTNLTDNTGLNVGVSLISPAIDLTAAVEATLAFAHFRDIEAGFDFGEVRVLDADAGDAQLAVVVTDLDGQVDWETLSVSIPAEALGKNVKFEFYYEADTFNGAPEPFAGWYIDDVEVTAR